MRLIRIVLLALVALLPDLVPASAEKRVALVVGNNAYRATTPLANPLNDARDMATALKGAGFSVIEALDADKLKLDGALRAFADQLSQADVALFFYAGHGLQVGAQNYLVPIDAKLEKERDLEFEAVKLEFVLRQMEIDREGKTTIVILDACRDNPLSRNLARSMGTRSTAIGKGLAAAPAGLGTFIAYSTQPGNVALDGDGRNSPFTSALVKHMGVRGRNLPATMIEVRKQVVASTGGRQVPWDHSALTGDFYFQPGAPVAPGTVAAAPAGSGTDIAALQERLRVLEEEARKREAAAKAAPASGGSPNAAAPGADAIRLAELRTRASDLDALVKDLQTKLARARSGEEGATDPSLKAKHARDVQGIEAEMTRRQRDHQQLEVQIAGLEGRPAGAARPTPAAAVPITPKARVQKVSPLFEEAENVRIDGIKLSEKRQPSPVACRESCDQEPSCVAFQHGRRIPVSGQCQLFARVDARQEDPAWRSGVRLDAAAPTEQAALSVAGRLPANFSGKPSRRDKGFDIYDGLSVMGEQIKMSTADSPAGCQVVCRNTPGCVIAVYNDFFRGKNPACQVFREISNTMKSPSALMMVRTE